MSSDLSGPLPEPGQNNLWFHYNDSDSVFVFLHGIFADSRSCWLHKDNRSPACSVYWPALVRSDLRFGDPSIYLAGYYTAPDAGPYEIRNCADEVLGALNRQDAEGRPGPMTKPTMVFVCHSTGGIVARYLLEESEARFVAKNLGLVLIASPSYGSKWANRLELLARLYNQRLGIQLQWGNWNLRDLDARFKNLLNQQRLPRLRGVEAYENHFVVHRRWLPNRSVVVTDESAGRYFGAPVLLRKTNHFTCVNPESLRHPAHELLVDFWTEMTKRRVQEALKNSIIKRFSEIIAVTSYGLSPLTEWPVRTDLISGDNGRLYEDCTCIEALDRLVCGAAPRRALLRGAEGRGKTVLARLLAFRKEQLGWEAFVVDIRLLSTMARQDTDRTVEAIETIITTSAKPSLFIFENAHLSDDISSALVRYIDCAAEHYDNLHALFVSRDLQIDGDLNPFRSWKRREWCLTAKPDQAAIRGVVRQQLKSKKSSYKLTEKDTEWLEQRFMIRTSIRSGDVGGNLRLLRLYLDVWDDETTELAQLSEDHVIAGVKQHIHFNELHRNEELEEQLGKVASVFQFDVPFYALSHSETDIREARRLLGQLGYLVINLGQYFYGLAHSVDAHWIVKCLASIHKDSSEEFTAHRLIRYFRSVIGTIPADRVGKNIWSLMRNLGLFSSTQFDKNKVFAVLYKEARELLLEICLRYNLNITPNVLQLVKKTYDLKKAFQFWKELYGGMPPERWREKIENSDIRAVARVLEKVSEYSKDDGLAFYRSYLQSRSLADADITSFQLFTLYLPPEEIEAIVTSLDVQTFARNAVEGGTLTNLNFAIDHIERAASARRFLEKMFEIICAQHYEGYRSLLLNATNIRPIDNHITHLNKYSPTLRTTIQKDEAVRSRKKQLAYTRTKVIDGVRVITKKYVKWFVGITSYDSFVSHFNHNFSGEFRLKLNELDLIHKLIRTVDRFTQNADNTVIAERGRSVIGQIVRALTDEQFRDVCCDREFLEDLESIDKSLFANVNEKCKSVF